MKNRIIATLGLLTILGGSLAFMTACGKDADVKSLSEKLDTSISSVQNSNLFKEKTYNVNGTSYSFYAPKYVETMETKLKKDAEAVLNGTGESSDIDSYLKSNLSTYGRIGVDYDLAFGYAFNSIKKCNSIIKNNYENLNKASSSVENLLSSLDNFTQATKNQEKVIENTNSYWSNISAISSDLTENALYNYMKDYEGYVRTSINLAREIYDAVEELCPSVSYKEQDASQLAVDTTMNMSKISIKKGTKLYILSIVGEKTKTYKFTYVDNNSMVWNFSEVGDYKTAKVGETVSLDKDLELQATYVGRRVNKKTKVQVTEMVEGDFFKVQYVDSEGGVWTKTLISDGENIKGEIKVDQEVELTKDMDFDFSSKKVKKGVEVQILEESSDTYSIRYIDSLGYVWEQNVASSKVEVTPATEGANAKYTLAEDTLFEYKGLSVKANANVCVTDEGSGTVNVVYRDGNYVWSADVNKSDLTKAEKSLYEELSLETLSEYYTICVEKMSSKAFTQDEFSKAKGNEYLYNTMIWTNNFVEFMKKATVHQNADVQRKWTTEGLNNIKSTHNVYLVNRNMNGETLNNLNLTNIRFFEDWELSKEEKLNFKKIQTYYNDVFVSWVDYYLSIL